MWVSLCQIDELKDGEGKYVEIDGFRLAVFLHQGRVYAMDNICPHAGGSLSGGHIDAEHVVCPWHGWCFELSSGKLRGAGQIGVGSYTTRLFKRTNKPDLVQADLPSF